jgi:uncharacterized protein (DUF362 family)
MKSKVAVVRVRPESILHDIEKLCGLAGMRDTLDASATTILKDNISWHFPFPAANTTPWQLEGTILALRGAGFEDLTCVQNQTVVTDAFKGEDLNRYVPVLKHYDVPVLYNFKSGDMKWIEYKPKARMRVLDKIYPDGIRLPDYFFGKNIVHLPTVKCHIYSTTTGAMKNAFGGLLHDHRHYTHSWIHDTLVDLLAIQKEIHPGMFAVMDGTICGDGAGPRAMQPVVKDYMLASDDMVAIDATSAWLMGFDPLADVDCIRIAHERGLGVGDVREIEVVGEDVSEVNFDFHVRYHFASRVGRLLWFTPLARIQALFFRTPLVHAFIWGSALYHDRYWWPVHGRKRMASIAETPWGRLFESYE